MSIYMFFLFQMFETFSFYLFFYEVLSSLFLQVLAWLFSVRICAMLSAELALYITGMRSLRKDNLSPALQGDLRELGSECSHHAVPKQYNCHTEEHILTHAFPYVFQSKGHRSLKWGHLMPSEGLSYVKNWNINLSTWWGFSLQTPLLCAYTQSRSDSVCSHVM